MKYESDIMINVSVYIFHNKNKKVLFKMKGLDTIFLWYIYMIYLKTNNSEKQVS